MITTNIKRSKGRPSKFNRDDVLQKAMTLFCERGFDNTSVAQLCEATGLKPPSLYASFTDKTQLFCEVLEAYHQPYRQLITELFAQPVTTVEALHKLLEKNKMAHCNPQTTGCLIANSSIQVIPGALSTCQTEGERDNISQRVKQLHDWNEEALHQRIMVGQQQGDVGSAIDCRVVAQFINGVIQGAAVLARGQRSTSAVESLLHSTQTLLPSLLATQR